MMRVLYRLHRALPVAIWVMTDVVIPCGMVGILCLVGGLLLSPAAPVIGIPLRWIGGYLTLPAFHLGETILSVAGVAVLFEMCGRTPRRLFTVPHCRWISVELGEGEVEWFERRGVRTKERERLKPGSAPTPPGAPRSSGDGQ